MKTLFAIAATLLFGLPASSGEPVEVQVERMRQAGEDRRQAEQLAEIRRLACEHDRRERARINQGTAMGTFNSMFAPPPKPCR